MKKNINYEQKKSFKLNNGTTVYMKESMFIEHIHELNVATDYILKKCRNLHSLDLSDVSAGGIQLGGEHNFNRGYIAMYRTIKYDFSNLDECVKTFIAEWNDSVNENIAQFKKFTDECEKYGWD